jgi:hypothetical protein
MLAEVTSPTVISAGSNCVLTVTLIPPKLIGGAISPPSPCPNAFGTRVEIVKIPINATNNVSLLYNSHFCCNSIFKDAIELPSVVLW